MIQEEVTVMTASHTDGQQMHAAFADLAAATYKNWLSPVVMTCSATEFPASAIHTVIKGMGGYAQTVLQQKWNS